MKSLLLSLLAAASTALAADVPLVTFYFDDPSPNTVAPFLPSATAKGVKAGPIERGSGFTEGDALPGVDEYQKPSPALSGKVDLQIPLNKTPDTYDLLYIAGEGATHAGMWEESITAAISSIRCAPGRYAAGRHARRRHRARARFFLPRFRRGVRCHRDHHRLPHRIFPRGRAHDSASRPVGGRARQWRRLSPLRRSRAAHRPAAPADQLVEKKVLGQPFTIPAGKTALFRFTAYGPAEHSDSGQPFVLDDITLGGTVGPRK